MIYSNPIYTSDAESVSRFCSTDEFEAVEGLLSLCLYSPNQLFAQEICFSLLERNDILLSIKIVALMGLGHTERNTRIIDICRLKNIFTRLTSKELEGVDFNLLDDIGLNQVYKKEVEVIKNSYLKRIAQESQTP